jgi:hypothetical protein
MEDSADRPEDGRVMIDAATSRRRMLQLGVLGASAVVTIRPALAQTAASVMTCQIPIPDQAHAGEWIAANGDLVPAGTQGAAPPAPRPVTGEEAKQMLVGQTPPGFDPNTTQAYTSYIRRLQQGVSGFTCYASLQMPRP